MADPTLRVLSLGGGTQSTVLLVAGAQGAFGPPPDLAVFADTGAEPPEVYEMIDWLTANAGVEVITARADGQPLDEALATVTDKNRRPSGAVIPTFTIDNNTGDEGLGLRFCTTQWKIRPIESAVRARLGKKRVNRGTGIAVEQWLGFSTDEIARCKPNQTHWITNRFPLIEAGMSRWDCQRWWDDNAPTGAPPLGRSACFFCPYHSSAEWISLKQRHPDLIARAAQLEKDHQATHAANGYGHMEHYLHRRRIPLAEAIAKDEADADAQPSLFDQSDLCGESCFT